MVRKAPLIFDVARGSGVDGPGIRSVVFMKGCPLRCCWCQNPESHEHEEETFFDPDRCIGCGNCSEGLECDSLARQKAGVYYSPAGLVRIILRDRLFYQVSGGGVTFSGGEPFLFLDYLHEVFKSLKCEHIHIAVETSGYFEWKHFESKLLSMVDLILFDLKVMDPLLHEKYTGKSNDVILENFRNLRQTPVELLPRVPLVNGYTADEENLTRLARFLREQDILQYSLLSYNPSGLEKWHRLGKTPPEDIPSKPMTLREEQRWRRFFKNQFEKSGTRGELQLSFERRS